MQRVQVQLSIIQSHHSLKKPSLLKDTFLNGVSLKVTKSANADISPLGLRRVAINAEQDTSQENSENTITWSH